MKCYFMLNGDIGLQERVICAKWKGLYMLERANVKRLFVLNSKMENGDNVTFAAIRSSSSNF